jgi:hypothetical protein
LQIRVTLRQQNRGAIRESRVILGFGLKYTFPKTTTSPLRCHSVTSIYRFALSGQG